MEELRKYNRSTYRNHRHGHRCFYGVPLHNFITDHDRKCFIDCQHLCSDLRFFILAAVTETILSFDKFFPTKKETDLLFRTEDLFLFYLLFKKFFYGSGNTSV